MDLYANNLGANPESMKHLAQTMKYLPNSLKNLKLDVSYNFLAEHAESFEYFVEQIKYLPNNLQNLIVNLANNDLDIDDYYKIEDYL